MKKNKDNESLTKRQTNTKWKLARWVLVLVAKKQYLKTTKKASI